MRGSESNDA